MIKKKLLPIFITLLLTTLFLIFSQDDHVQPIIVNTTNDLLVWNFSLDLNSNGRWRKLDEKQVIHTKQIRIMYND